MKQKWKAFRCGKNSEFRSSKIKSSKNDLLDTKRKSQ